MGQCEYDGWEFYQTGHHQFRADYEKKIIIRLTYTQHRVQGSIHKWCPILGWWVVTSYVGRSENILQMGC